MNAAVLPSADVELFPVAPLSTIRDFLHPEAMPDVYGLVADEAFPRGDIAAGDAVLIERRANCAIGDLVVVYFRPGAKQPLRLVGEMATAIPPRGMDGPGSEVRPLLGLYLDSDAMATFFPMCDVIAVHRIYARSRDLYVE